MFSAVSYDGTLIYLDLDDNMAFNDPWHRQAICVMQPPVLILFWLHWHHVTRFLQQIAGSKKPLISFVHACFEPLSREIFISIEDAIFGQVNNMNLHWIS